MAASVINGGGAAAPDATQSTLAITIPSSAADSALAALAFFVSPSSRTFSSTGSTYTNAFDDGSNFAFGLASPAQAGTTSVVANAGAASQITAAAAEAVGLKPGGQVFASTLNTQAGVTAWSTPSINPTVPVLAFAVSAQPTDGSFTSTFGAGWTPVPGLASGNVQNLVEGNGIAVAWRLAPPGSLSGSGTWSGSALAFSYIVAFEVLPDVGFANSPAHPGRGPAMAQFAFRPTQWDASLPAVAAALDATVSAQSTVSAGLTTQIALSGSASASCTVTAALTTQIRLAATAQSAVTVSADLSVGAGLSAAISAQCTAAAALGTSIRLVASGGAACTVSATLSTAIRLTAAVSAQCVVGAGLSTAIRLAAAAQASASVASSLSTAISLAAQAIANAQASAALTTQIRMQASALGETTVVAALTVAAGVASGGRRSHRAMTELTRGGGEPLSRAQPTPLRRK